MKPPYALSSLRLCVSASLRLMVELAESRPGDKFRVLQLGPAR